MIRTPLQAHVSKWREGCGSDMCTAAQYVVIGKGKVPCDILFVGEAPGSSENVAGQPFVGPAGHLLDQIVEQAVPIELRCAFTNLVGCIPLDEDGLKTKEPEKDQIKCCQPRLVEFVRLCQPKVIVCVGALAKKWITGHTMFEPVNWLPRGQLIEFTDITHPAAILRANVAQQGIAVRQCIARITSTIARTPNL